MTLAQLKIFFPHGKAGSRKKEKEQEKRAKKKKEQEKLTAFALFLICMSSSGCFECLLKAACAFIQPSFVIPCPFSAFRPAWISTNSAFINNFSISLDHVARSGFVASFSLPLRVITSSR